MDCTQALEAKDVAKRDELIQDEIDGHAWDGELENLPRGGWPEDAEATKATIKDNGDELVVKVDVIYVEYVHSGCKDHPTAYDRTACFTIGIDKADGTYLIQDSSYGPDDDELYPDDYL